MKKILTGILTLFSIYSIAQSPVAARLNSGLDLGMAYSKSNYNPSLAYYQLINIGERKIISLGWTARLGAFYGDNLDYYTAPARLTRGKTGLGALSGPIINSNIDTVRFDYITMTSFTVGVRAQINLGWLELGASADILGLTLGKYRTGRYQSSTGKFMIHGSSGKDSVSVYYQGANTFQQAHPSRLNVRLLGDNDIGTLSTEVYARVRLNQRLGIKAGYQLLTTEVTVTNRDIIADNNRFRHRTGLVYVALSFPLFY